MALAGAAHAAPAYRWDRIVTKPEATVISAEYKIGYRMGCAGSLRGAIFPPVSFSPMSRKF